MTFKNPINYNKYMLIVQKLYSSMIKWSEYYFNFGEGLFIEEFSLKTYTFISFQ